MKNGEKEEEEANSTTANQQNSESIVHTAGGLGRTEDMKAKG
jgi:hypothetical protein